MSRKYCDIKVIQVTHVQDVSVDKELSVEGLMTLVQSWKPHKDGTAEQNPHRCHLTSMCAQHESTRHTYTNNKTERSPREIYRPLMTSTHAVYIWERERQIILKTEGLKNSRSSRPFSWRGKVSRSQTRKEPGVTD